MPGKARIPVSRRELCFHLFNVCYKAAQIMIIKKKNGLVNFCNETIKMTYVPYDKVLNCCNLLRCNKKFKI